MGPLATSSTLIFGLMLVEDSLNLSFKFSTCGSLEFLQESTKSGFIPTERHFWNLQLLKKGNILHKALMMECVLIFVSLMLLLLWLNSQKEFQNYLLAFISCELVEWTKRHRVPDAFQSSFPFTLNRSSEEVSAGKADWCGTI